MRILFDDEVFFRQRFGGVSRIFAKLVEGIEQMPQHHLLFNCKYSENEYLLELKPQINSFFKPYPFPLKGKLVRGIYGRYSHWQTIKSIKKNNADVFHPTFYADYYLKALIQENMPLVFTVHDLIHEQTPNNAHYAEMAKIKADNIKIAKQIIVVSEHTKKDLLRIYPYVNPEQVNIIPLAQSLPEQGIKPKKLPDNYILFTGERGGYKNFISLLNAFAELSKINPDVHLYCAGSASFSNDELALAQKLNVNNKLHHAKLSDAELRYVYQHAKLFVFPSTYEGFGMPMLEAFSAETPVVAHHATSLPEVGGDAAYYVDATDVKKLTNAINQVLTNTKLQQELVKKGKIREQQFTWQNHISLTLQVYQKAVK
jgi:glycosyltransferase involved in cell wall biosynthesis